jgi:hypothetical protein
LQNLLAHKEQDQEKKVRFGMYRFSSRRQWTVQEALYTCLFEFALYGAKIGNDNWVASPEDALHALWRETSLLIIKAYRSEIDADTKPRSKYDMVQCVRIKAFNAAFR